MSLLSDCARCAGPVAIWAWPGRPIDIRRNWCRIVESNSTGGLWPYLGRIRGMVIGVSIARWPKKAGRSAASRCNVSVGVKASTCAQSPRKSRGVGVSTGLPTQAKHQHHVWTWDFIFDRTDNGGTLKMMTLLDEYTRQCLDHPRRTPDHISSRVRGLGKGDDPVWCTRLYP